MSGPCRLSLLLAAVALLEMSGCSAEGQASPTTTIATTTTKPTLPPPVHCIVCDDLKDDHCTVWDGFSHSKLCNNDTRLDKTKPFGCRTTIQQVYNKKYVSRQCTNLVSDDLQGCIERVGTYKIKMLYCHCKGDNCNSASGLSVRMETLLLPLLALLLLR